MTAVAERPVISDGTPEEWLVELYMAVDLKHSTRFLEDMKKEEAARHSKERRAQQLEREAREREDALQEAHAEEIAEENRRHAAALAASACSSCFCIHAGEC